MIHAMTGECWSGGKPAACLQDFAYVLTQPAGVLPL